MIRPVALLLLAAAGAAAAEVVSSQALFAAAIGLAVLTLLAGLAVALAASRLAVARTISAREVQEDDPIDLRFDVRGFAWLPVRLEAEDQSGDWVELTAHGGSLGLTVGRRGTYRLGPSRLRLRDALGIFERRLLAGQPERLLILPAPERAAAAELRRAGAVDDEEPQGLKPYTPGAPLARIHWPALARGAGLQVLHFAEAPADGPPLVLVDTAAAPSTGALDWAARTAAGYILALARDGGCRVLLPGDTTEASVNDVGADWRAVHRRLATLTASAASGSRAARNPHAVHVRAAAAPVSLAPARPLPAGVIPVGHD